MDGIRWEEIWDVALRIRSTFLAEPLSELLRITVAEGLKLLNSSAPLAVRSSAIGEDAALLYRQELGLDPSRSRMAVVVREMVHADHSGVAFARDPRDMRKDHAIIELVPGPCSLLVDGLVDPDRWVMHRATCDVVEWLPGQREDSDGNPLLEPNDLETILQTLLSIEQLFGWLPDMEWTGRLDSLTVLQARPIATAVPDDDVHNQNARREFSPSLPSLSR